MDKKTFIMLGCIAVISLFLNAFQQHVTPPCINADEAAFNYNAYSILKTGKDEYGATMPLRLKSFGDYKLPLYSYLSVPVIAIMDLNDTSARMLNNIIAILFPIVVFFLVKELFKKEGTAFIAAGLVAGSLGLHIVGRHAHEAYLTAFLITTTLYLFIRTLKKQTVGTMLLLGLSLLASLFSYQSSRIFAVFFILAATVYAVVHKTQRKSMGTVALLLLGVLLAFSVTDIIYRPERVKNLLFFSSSGFASKITELRAEGGPRLIYNKGIIGLRDILMEHSTYFSPQFLAINGDTNNRFGFPQMGPITLVEYVFIFIGLYYLFKNKEPWRWLMVSIWLIAPITASLSWQTTSLTRSLFMLVPTLIISSYGFYELMYDIRKTPLMLRVVLIMSGVTFIFFQVLSWDFYLNHYPKRALTKRSWQCGYKELTDYVKSTYDRTDSYYITRKNGSPYIFLLYYLQYSPSEYQKQATLTPPDEYGFGQVLAFDKFNFEFRTPENAPNSVIVGYPDDFNGTGIGKEDVQVITSGTEEMFWIYDPQRKR